MHENIELKQKQAKSDPTRKISRVTADFVVCYESILLNLLLFTFLFKIYTHLLNPIFNLKDISNYVFKNIHHYEIIKNTT